MVRGRTHSAPAPSRARGLVRALIVAALAFTAACAPRIAAQGVEMRMPAIEKGEGTGVAADRYVTRDGLKLGLEHWDAAEPKAVIVGLHGMSDYSNAFAMPAPWWAEQGISTYAYDQRGFGRSPNTGIWGGDDIMCRDLSDFVGVMHVRFPGVPVFVLGESMGGAVAMTAFASPSPPNADGVILVAPAVWSRATMPLSYRIALWSTSHTFRWWSLSGSGLKIVPSDNVEMLRANYRDPLFQKSARADAIYGLVTLMDDAYNAPKRLNGKPLLLMYGGNDQIIPKGPTETIVKELGPDAAVKFYPKGYHMLLRDLDGKPRWADIAQWIAAQSRARTGAAVSMLEPRR